MKFHVRDIEDAAKELRYEEPTAALAQLLESPVEDFRLPPALLVAVSFYRAGTDLFFQGRADGPIVGRCSRCLEEYTFALAMDFAFVFAPHRELGVERQVEEEDTDLTYYEGDEVDLSPLLREQVLLALPTRPLCRENCAGLCPQCGANRNQIQCACHSEQGDPRLAILRTLKVHA
ncbi:MAG: DUF177 domain-containing protein [Deltaproteobacteria bacterium]|nr:DUF177 domain-containing protein [Deltaproteobacteria bacterium]